MRGIFSLLNFPKITLLNERPQHKLTEAGLSSPASVTLANFNVRFFTEGVDISGDSFAARMMAEEVADGIAGEVEVGGGGGFVVEAFDKVVTELGLHGFAKVAVGHCENDVLEFGNHHAAGEPTK